MGKTEADMQYITKRSKHKKTGGKTKYEETPEQFTKDYTLIIYKDYNSRSENLSANVMPIFWLQKFCELCVVWLIAGEYVCLSDIHHSAMTFGETVGLIVQWYVYYPYGKNWESHVWM